MPGLKWDVYITHTERAQKTFQERRQKECKSWRHDVAITFTNHGSCSYFHKKDQANQNSGLDEVNDLQALCIPEELLVADSFWGRENLSVLEIMTNRQDSYALVDNSTPKCVEAILIILSGLIFKKTLCLK